MSATISSTKQVEISNVGLSPSSQSGLTVTPKMVPTSIEPAMVGPYYIAQELGHGASATVRLGIHSKTGDEVALKFVEKKPSSLSAENALRRRRVGTEVYALSQLDGHPNITRMVEFLETNRHFVIVTEYVPGLDLFHYLRHGCGKLVCHGLPINQAFGFFHQLVSVVGFCHAHGIAHRDLKPENILMTPDFETLKLADFGLAGLVKPNQQMQTACGSPHYVAPEIVRGDKYDGQACDVWSLGVMLFAMCSGRLPFTHRNFQSLMKSILRGEYDVPWSFSKDLRDLIQRMLCMDPRQRIDIEEIKTHPWWLEHCALIGLPSTGTSEKQNSNSDKPPFLMTGESLCGMAPVPAPYDAEVLNWMIRIQGCDVYELIRSLKCRSPNVIKAYYVLLLQQKRTDAFLFSSSLNVDQTLSDEGQSPSTTSSDLPSVKMDKKPPTTAPENPPIRKAGWKIAVPRKLKSLFSSLRAKVCKRNSTPQPFGVM